MRKGELTRALLRMHDVASRTDGGDDLTKVLQQISRDAGEDDAELAAAGLIELAGALDDMPQDDADLMRMLISDAVDALG